MKMNRAIFFNQVRSSVFGGRLSTKQVDGMNRIIDYWEDRYPQIDADRFSYILSTVKGETGNMQPIKEKGGRRYFTRMYDIKGKRPYKARELGNIHPGDGAKFPGMGLIQNTGRRNARRASELIHEVLGKSVDFESQPKLLMEWEYALPLMFEGFIRGVWTGKKLDDYFNDGDGDDDLINARRIVNGRDKARAFAAWAKSFRSAIEAAMEAEPVDVIEAEAAPEPVTSKKPAKSTTIWAQIMQWAATGGTAAMTAIGNLDWKMVLAAGGILSVAAGLWIIRERLMKMDDGV